MLQPPVTAPASPASPASDPAPGLSVAGPASAFVLAAVLDRLPHPVLALDAAWGVTVANARALALLNPPDAPVLGAALWDLVPGLRGSVIGRCCVRAVVTGRPQSVEGAWPGLPGWHRVHAVPGSDGGLVLHVGNVTAERRLAAQATARAAARADRDVLTGLLDRRAFTARLAGTIARLRAEIAANGEGSGGAADGPSAAVLLLDLDEFAAVNAAHGHEAGDRLLRTVAARLGAAARRRDTVARLGADEFAVLLPGVGPDAAAAVGARVLATLTTAPAAAGPAAPANGWEAHPGAAGPAATGARDEARDKPPVSACLGLVLVDGAMDADAVLRHAGLALRRAKGAGRGQLVRFTPAMHAEARTRQTLTAALGAALERGEFSLVYQPVVDLPTGAPSGVEALLRWTHPTLGVVSPATFIPLAEELGLIAPIGHWVLRTACATIASLAPPVGTAAGGGAAGLSVAVNVSGHQLHADGFADDVTAALAAAGLAPERLTVEVTETALVRDARRAPGARRVTRAGRAGGARRLRHRLLVARVPAAAAARRAQARQAIC